MPRTAPVPECSAENREVLEERARRRTLEARLVERAQIMLSCLAGTPVTAVMASLKVWPNTVIDWRRFEAEEIAGCRDHLRPGQLPRYAVSLASACRRRDIYGHAATPFIWRNREIKESQL